MLNLKNLVRLLTLAVFIGVLVYSYGGSDLFSVKAVTGVQEEGPRIGAKAPAFTLKDLEGKDVSLEDFRGKAVLLNFWTTWCPPCRQEVPALQGFYEKYGDRVQVIGVDILENKAAVERFAKKNKITYPILLDSQGRVAAEYRIKLIPTSFFIDDDGVIQEIITGPLSIERLAYTFAQKVFRSDLIPFGLPMQVIAYFDPNEDGNPEAALLEADGDGQPDGGMIDANSDGQSEATAVIFKKVARGLAPPDTVQLKKALDLTGELIVQHLSIDLNNNGNPEIELEDKNFDGLPDEIFLDPDDDGTADLRFP